VIGARRPARPEVLAASHPGRGGRPLVERRGFRRRAAHDVYAMCGARPPAAFIERQARPRPKPSSGARAPPRRRALAALRAIPDIPSCAGALRAATSCACWGGRILHRRGGGVRHMSVLRGDRPASIPTGERPRGDFLEGGVRALTRTSRSCFGYGAAYHPWPRRRANLRGPPARPLRDGRSLGTYAARPRTHAEAWVAPARPSDAGDAAARGRRRRPAVDGGAAGIKSPRSGTIRVSWPSRPPPCRKGSAAVRPVNVRRWWHGHGASRM